MLHTTTLEKFTTNHLSELEIVLTCSSPQPESEKTEKLKRMLEKSVYWPALLNLANRHRVTPLVYAGFNPLKERIPPKIFQQLHLDFRLNSRRSLLLSGELINLLKLFEKEGIVGVPFKGAVLGASAYGNCSLRQFTDIDLLIREKDIEKAKAVLLAQGYGMKIERIELTAEQEEKFLRSRDIYHFVREAAYPFVHRRKKLVVELHWGIMPKYFSFPLETEAFWNTLQTVTISGQEVPCLSPETTLFVLVGHGTKDCWGQLARIADIAYLIHSHPELDWDRIQEQARCQRVQRMLGLGLKLASELLGIDLPENIQEKLNRDPSLKSLVPWVYQQLFDPQFSSEPDGTQTRFHLQVREHFADRLNYFVQLATTPTTSDWLLLPLAEFPRFPYYFLRPYRLVREQIMKVMPKQSH
ncbi:nucleotidyltransferase domain-containing protein [Phormidium sp. CCY1219]|uniref:nucleotidyltransferase domain-containing protein n=1 Tax=Phormidium sp. CCY1219 TaxID=2886104 RepID=UPI002D1F59C3|nr:nucleotidyltransferase family protein [Phormidium sp. CCY1219]MEB3829135.1 nucleotidyltransferase family protein [Phormidium sp. CCY1219]